MPKGFACRVERHSVYPATGRELFTAVIRFPRAMLAEAITHRKLSESWGDIEVTTSERMTTLDLSKNSASTRAIPAARAIRAVMEDPYIPMEFGINRPGMQATEYATGRDWVNAVDNWLDGRDRAVVSSLSLLTEETLGKILDDMQTYQNDKTLSAGVLGFYSGPTAKGPLHRDRIDRIRRSVVPNSFDMHKQEQGRPLETYGWTTQVVTGDDIGWANFFALRCHEAAYPAFRQVARMTYLAKRKSEPEAIEPGQWHLPFVDRAEASAFRFMPDRYASNYSDPLPQLIRMSAARCAWISYENHDRDASVEAHERTYATLVGGFPKHASPIEHQGMPTPTHWEAAYPNLRSNLRGYVQARKLLAMENVEAYEPKAETVAAWGIDEDKMWID